MASESRRARLLQATLYPMARLVRPLLKLGNEEYFRSDENLLDDLLLLRRKRDFDTLAGDYMRARRTAGKGGGFLTCG